MFPAVLLALLALAMILTALGFIRYSYFWTVGFGLATAGEGIAILLFSWISYTTTWELFAVTTMITLYGFRFAFFAILRKSQNVTYRKAMTVVLKRRYGFFRTVGTWLLVSVICVLETVPVLYRTLNTESSTVIGYVGAGWMLVAFILQAVADRQQTVQKNRTPNMVAMHGLYRLCRYPSYFAAFLFWTGALFSGITAIHGRQWAVALLGYAGSVILLIQISAARELRQDRIYGISPKYCAYADHTPILFPFVPLYHLRTRNERSAMGIRNSERK